MGMGLLPLEPNDDIPLKYPTMSWRLWYAFADLLDAIGADTTQIAYANDGDVIDADTCRQWAALLRSIAPGAQRFVRGPLCWFELAPDPDGDGAGEATSTAGTGMALRGVLFASSDAHSLDAPMEQEDPDETRDYLLYLAAFFDHCGGCQQV